MRWIMIFEARQANEIEKVARPRIARVARYASGFQRKGHILDSGAPGKGRFFLEHHADFRLAAAHLFAVEQDLAIVIGEQAADHVHQRGLAAARRADDRDELALLNVERDIVDRGDAALGRVEMFRGMRDAQRGRHHDRSTCFTSALDMPES